MLTVKSLKMMMTTRSLSTRVRREVMISQSRDLLSNTALEDWAVKNINLAEKSVMILSNNITRTPATAPAAVEIKATLVDGGAFWRAEEFDRLVLASLPPDLALARLPDLETARRSLEPTATSYSLRLELASEVRTRTVLAALEQLGWGFLRGDEFEAAHDCPTHLSLVRPDDGWFPGLEAIRSDLERNFTRLRSSHTSPGLPSAAVSSKQGDCDQLQNSFGNV